MYQQIETERLLIRPISLDDHPFIYKLVNSEGWLKYIGDRQVANWNDAKNYIQKILNNRRSYYNVLVEKRTNESIGIVTILKRDNQGLPDFGFAVLPDYQRLGFAYEASRNYLDAILAKIGYSELIAITLSDNQASINLLNRLGFKWMINKKENSEVLSYFSLSKNSDKLGAKELY